MAGLHFVVVKRAEQQWQVFIFAKDAQSDIGTTANVAIATAKCRQDLLPGEVRRQVLHPDATRRNFRRLYIVRRLERRQYIVRRLGRR